MRSLPEFSFLDCFISEFPEENKIKIDLPYLDVSKLTCYIEEKYLYIKYDNPDDKRRKKFKTRFYVGNRDVSLKYEDGFLVIEFKEKEKERVYIKIQ